PVRLPWLSWGPYLWTDGLSGRSDGLLTVCPDDLESDFTHPSMDGHVPKVGRQLLAFFKTDPTATPWFLRTNGIGQPPTCAPSADVTSGLVPLTVNFSANASSGGAIIRDYQWTFEDGMFSTNANPVKIFPAPGTYRARLTVTDTNGNTAQSVLTIQAAAARLYGARYASNQFQFVVSSESNLNHIVQVSTNLTNWISLQTNFGPFIFTNSATNFPAQFYRTVSRP
ncbi:MAG: PKD domain-containing protein, partial [Verrucomicrobiota bacterium]